MIGWKIIEGPGEEPVTVEEVRSHIEAPVYEDSAVDPMDEAMLEGWIAAAREYCENYLGQSLTTRTIEAALDMFPSRWQSWQQSLGIDLPMGPVREIVSVTWGLESDEMLEDTAFTLDDFGNFHRLVPTSTLGWPVVPCGTNKIRIRYLAGYGSVESSEQSWDSEGAPPLPKSIRAAMLLVIGHLYANREETTEAVLMALPLGVKVLLDPYRVRLGLA